MSKYLWIIDAGHGGMKNGMYQTFPNKMFTFEDGKVIYEGVINREVAKKLRENLELENIDFKLVYDEELDFSLPKRVKMVNDIYGKNKNAIFISIHSNCSPAEVAGKGKGLEVWTSVGQTKSDIIGEIFSRQYERSFPEFHFRKEEVDGDYDKEANFYVLRNTDCPAVLFENLFFDNRKEAEFLWSENGQQRIADCILAGIKIVEVIKPI